MNLGVSSYITSAGLKAVTSGGSLGPYFALKYFIPFYDYRLDKTISRESTGTTSALSISGLNLVSATHDTLFGEKLFANAQYSLSDNRFLFWTSDMGTLIEGGTNNNVISRQSVSTDVNLLYGKPLSNTVSGTSVSTTATGFFTVTNTNVLSGSELTQYNPTSAVSWPSSAFYKVASYAPNVNGITSATGSYKCRIPPGVGSFKFNGIAVYAVKVDNNGFDDSGNGLNVFNYNPVLFSVILFDQAQYKQDTVGGVNDFEISVDLGFDWNTVNPGSSAQPMYVNSNYWIKLPTASSTSAYALNYDGDVVISTSAVPGSWTPRAKLTVTDSQKQQLRLANDDTRFTDIRTIRFPINLTGVSPNYNDRAVLSIDTSCPDDSLLQVGYATTAMGIKSIAMGCYASATGYYDNGFITEDFGDDSEVTIDDVRNDSGGYTVSIGVKSLAQGFGSWATGFETSSIGYLNFAGGDRSIASYFKYSPDFGVDQSSKNGLNFSFGKLTSAISREYQAKYSDCIYNSVGHGDEADDESYGSNVAFGVRTLSNGGLAFAHGNATSASGMASWSIGYKNFSEGCFSFTQGANNVAKYLNSWAVGQRVSALATFGYVFGKDSVAGNDDVNTYFSLAIGDNVSATNTHSIGIGKNVLSTGINSIAIGQQGGYNDYDPNALTIATGNDSISFGKVTSAIGFESISIGTSSLSQAHGSISIGNKNTISGKRGIGLGSNLTVAGENALATNYNTTAYGNYSLATGYANRVDGDQSFVGGKNSIANGLTSFAFGDSTSATGRNSIALGPNANAKNQNSVAIGSKSVTTSDNQIMIGSCDSNVVIKGSTITLGEGCTSNVIIPGLKQFNDSIGYTISTGPSTSTTYQMALEFYRDGLSVSKIVLESEVGVSEMMFTIKEISGQIQFKYQMSDYSGQGFKNRVTLKTNGKLNTTNYNTNLYWSDAASTLKTYVANMLLCFDDVDNSVIFYCQPNSYYDDVDNIQYNRFNDTMKDSTDLSLNDSEMLSKMFYSVAYNLNTSVNWIEAINHYLYRIKNVTYINGSFEGTFNWPLRNSGRSHVHVFYSNRLDPLTSLDGMTIARFYVKAYSPSLNSMMSFSNPYTSTGIIQSYQTPIEAKFLEMNTGLWYSAVEAKFLEKNTGLWYSAVL